MNLSYSQARLSTLPEFFAPLDYTNGMPQEVNFGGGGSGAPVFQTFGTIEAPASQASQAADIDVDAATTPQEVNEDDLIAPVALEQVSVTGAARPWLRRASLYKALNYNGPAWLTGQENWVYLVVLALALSGAWWYIKRK